MVTPGNRVCDVGCDHGFVAIYLAQQQISPHVLAMDVRQGPLGAAIEHIEQYGLQKQIETRLSDGLHKYEIGEADTLICAGMGGKLMQRILSQYKEKTISFQELVLQPQSEIQQFREFLRIEGYCIVDENIIRDNGKYYPMMRVVTKQETVVADEQGSAEGHAEASLNEAALKLPMEVLDRYGAVLLYNKAPVLLEFLRKEEENLVEILHHMENRVTQGAEQEQKRMDVEKRLAQCRLVQKEVYGLG